MRAIFVALLLQVFCLFPASGGYAAVAEASMGPEQDYIHSYDITGLSGEEQKWFVKFLQGTFFADGWQEIANYVLVKMPYEERLEKQQKLNELGYKIGREWCKDNSVRRIDTGMLKKWGALLKITAQENPQLLVDVIDHIDGEVNSLID